MDWEQQIQKRQRFRKRKKRVRIQKRGDAPPIKQLLDEHKIGLEHGLDELMEKIKNTEECQDPEMDTELCIEKMQEYASEIKEDYAKRDHRRVAPGTNEWQTWNRIQKAKWHLDRARQLYWAGQSLIDSAIQDFNNLLEKRNTDATFKSLKAKLGQGRLMQSSTLDDYTPKQLCEIGIHQKCSERNNCDLAGTGQDIKIKDLPHREQDGIVLFAHDAPLSQIPSISTTSASKELFMGYALIRDYELFPLPPEMIKEVDGVAEQVENPKRNHEDLLYNQLMGDVRLCPNRLGKGKNLYRMQEGGDDNKDNDGDNYGESDNQSETDPSDSDTSDFESAPRHSDWVSRLIQDAKGKSTRREKNQSKKVTGRPDYAVALSHLHENFIPPPIHFESRAGGPDYLALPPPKASDIGEYNHRKIAYDDCKNWQGYLSTIENPEIQYPHPFTLEAYAIPGQKSRWSCFVTENSIPATSQARAVFYPSGITIKNKNNGTHHPPYLVTKPTPLIGLPTESYWDCRQALSFLKSVSKHQKNELIQLKKREMSNELARDKRLYLDQPIENDLVFPLWKNGYEYSEIKPETKIQIFAMPNSMEELQRFSKTGPREFSKAHRSPPPLLLTTQKLSMTQRHKRWINMLQHALYQLAAPATPWMKQHLSFIFNELPGPNVLLPGQGLFRPTDSDSVESRNDFGYGWKIVGSDVSAPKIEFYSYEERKFGDESDSENSDEFEAQIPESFYIQQSDQWKRAHKNGLVWGQPIGPLVLDELFGEPGHVPIQNKEYDPYTSKTSHHNVWVARTNQEYVLGEMTYGLDFYDWN